MAIKTFIYYYLRVNYKLAGSLGGWKMKRMDSISGHDKEATQYDQQVREYNCYGHDVLNNI